MQGLTLPSETEWLLDLIKRAPSIWTEVQYVKLFIADYLESFGLSSRDAGIAGAALMLAPIIVLLVAASLRRKKSRFVKEAYRFHKRLKKSSDPIGFIQKECHHFVFEELILNALKARGHGIRRNTKHVHDGGIDGFFKLNGQWFAIQAKRYAAGNYIHRGDVDEFVYRLNTLAKPKRLFSCRKEPKIAGGIFVYTGKRGKYDGTERLSKKLSMSFICETDLINLLLDKKEPISLRKGLVL